MGESRVAVVVDDDDVSPESGLIERRGCRFRLELEFLEKLQDGVVVKER